MVDSNNWKYLAVLYTHIINMLIYIQTQWIMTSEDFFRKICTSHFIARFACERELETEQNYNILTQTPMAISVVSFSFFRAAQPEDQRPTLLGAGFLYRILSPTGLQTLSEVPRAPSAGWWLSLPHLFLQFLWSPTRWLRTRLISNSLTSCLHRVI